MTHLLDVHWAQLVLIQGGIVCLLVAIYLFLSEALEQRRLSAHRDGIGHEGDDDDDSESPRSNQPAVKRTGGRRGEGFDEPSGDRLKTAGLTQTSTVKFRQSFNFRRHGTQG
jgi:hypothetical protein